MVLEKSLTRIREFLLDRYKDNLAGVLLFGTANTGEFRKGKSDIDTMIFVKEQNGLNLDNEIKFLVDALKSERFATQYFHTLEGIVEYVNKRNSFSTYITILSPEASRILYSTPEFDATREKLRKNPPSKENLKKYIQEKDKFELEGYFKEIKGFKLTKALFAHLRRKLQIMNYFRTGELVFDPAKFIKDLDLSEDERKEFLSIYDYYSNRKSLSNKSIRSYYDLARQFTTKITESKNI